MYNEISGFNHGGYGQSGLTGSTRAMRSMRIAIAKAANSVLSAFDEVYPVLNLHIDSSKKEATQQLNGLFVSDGLLEGKEHLSMDVVFFFVTAFMDRCIGISERPKLKALHTLYSEWMHTVYVGLGNLSWT